MDVLETPPIICDRCHAHPGTTAIACTFGIDPTIHDLGWLCRRCALDMQRAASYHQIIEATLVGAGVAYATAHRAVWRCVMEVPS